jgi:hypothetical protein
VPHPCSPCHFVVHKRTCDFFQRHDRACVCDNGFSFSACTSRHVISIMCVRVTSSCANASTPHCNPLTPTSSALCAFARRVQHRATQLTPHHSRPATGTGTTTLPRYGFPEGYNKTPEGAERVKKVREAFLANTLPKFAKFFGDQIDGKGGAFLCGPELTIADCFLAPELKKLTMGYIDHVPVTSLDAYPALTAYLARFYAHPKIKAYYDAKL